MTIHRLTTPGSKRTQCSLNVPTFQTPKPNDTTWEDGDEGGGKQCADGCWTPLTTDELREATARYPSVAALQRFDVMASGPKGTSLRAGFAMVNRDGSIAVQLDSLPVDGKLRLVPKGGG